jgi:hypothetical protein
VHHDRAAPPVRLAILSISPRACARAGANSLHYR